jgi:hypothetical protein
MLPAVSTLLCRVASQTLHNICNADALLHLKQSHSTTSAAQMFRHICITDVPQHLLQNYPTPEYYTKY